MSARNVDLDKAEVDECFASPKKKNKINASARNANPNAAAACAYLSMWQTAIERALL